MMFFKQFRSAGCPAIMRGIVTLVMLSGAVIAQARERPFLRDPQQIVELRKGRTNEARTRALVRWRLYLELSDEETWALLPGPMVYRAMDVNLAEGCPKCGQEAYKARTAAFRCDLWKSPWKTTCAECGETFPKNDFRRFYQSGLGADGLFDPTRADRKLLFNTEHP